MATMVTSLGSLAVWQKSQRSIIFGLLIASRKGFEVVFCLHRVQHGANLPSYKAKNEGRMEKPKSGIRNWNRNRNLRNKNWRRFCLESVTNNNCSIKTFHPHIIFIYCYYIFYCRIFCVQRKIFLQEFHMRVCVATWDHDCHEYSSSFCRLSFTMDETRSPLKKRYE